MGFVYFVIMIGVLVFVHELGHFLVAKAFDVKVIRFSIGFGPKLFGYQRGETEYALCALPLGGYVLMLGGDMADAESIPEEDLPRTLLAKPIWQRSLVILAGPAFNIILPILVFFFFGLTQTTAPPSMVGEVLADTPAEQIGLQAGDRITKLGDDEVTYWHEILDVVSDSPGQPLEIAWERDGKTMTATITPESRTETQDAIGILQTTRGQIGILLDTHGPTVAVTSPESVAAQAGLKTFDRIIEINGTSVDRYDAIARIVRTSQGKQLDVVALRPTKLPAQYGDFFTQKVITLKMTPAQNDEGVYDVGLARAELVLSEVDQDSPAAEAGFKPGDRITKLDGTPQRSWYILRRTIYQSINEKLLAREPGDDSIITQTFTIEYERDGKLYTTELTPRVTKYTDEYQQDRYKREIGWATLYDTTKPDVVEFPFGDRIVYSAKLGLDKTWEGMSMIGRLFQRIVEGKVSFSKQVGGPILVGELAARAGEAGMASFLWTMALLSINIGVFNMLPIPLLDGGRLMLFAAEAIKRGPLSFRTRQITSYIGFVFIILLMVLAFKNDIERNWDRIVDFLF